MSRTARAVGFLAAAVLAAAVPALAGSISTVPAAPSTHDEIRITFFEPNWTEVCPPLLADLATSPGEITARLEINDGACIPELDRQRISFDVGPLEPGIYTVTVDAPNTTTMEREITTSTLEVVGAVQCGLPNQPAATLLLPYFEVDLEDPGGRDTLFSVGNASFEATLAHAVVWTNWGHPAVSFDFMLPARGLLSFDVRSLLDGQLPETPAAEKSPAEKSPPPIGVSCTDPLTQPAVDPAALKARLTGQPDPGDGLCYSGAVEGGRLATGYITIDVVHTCSGSSVTTPNDFGYFQDSGAGLGANDNVLWGDFFLVDPAADFAQGEKLVAVTANAGKFGSEIVCIQPPCPSRIPASFYTPESNRMPLPRTYEARFLKGGGFEGGTELVLWFEGTTGPMACGSDPGQVFIDVTATARNEAGDFLAENLFISSETTMRLAVGEDPLALGQSFGIVELSAVAINSIIGVPDVRDLQIWVMPLVSGEGRFSVGLSAVPVVDFCRRPPDGFIDP